MWLMRPLPPSRALRRHDEAGRDGYVDLWFLVFRCCELTPKIERRVCVTVPLLVVVLACRGWEELVVSDQNVMMMESFLPTASTQKNARY